MKTFMLNWIPILLSWDVTTTQNGTPCATNDCTCNGCDCGCGADNSESCSCESCSCHE